MISNAAPPTTFSFFFTEDKIVLDIDDHGIVVSGGFPLNY